MISWRYQQAARLAKQFVSDGHDVVIGHVGDGAGKPEVGLSWGDFNRQAVEYYGEVGLEGVVISNGGCLESANTKGDMMALVNFVQQHGFDEVIVVTCWYHTVRTWANWYHARVDLGVAVPPIRLTPVWRDIRRGLRALPGELHGTLDALRCKPQNSRRSPVHLRS
jgi:uncharacterized SAM-binding protein YcdF (DUF218 family)